MTFRAKWAHMPGLRLRLLLNNIQARTPLWLLLCAVQYVVLGRCSAVGIGCYAAITAAVQHAGHVIGALVILPANRRTLDLVNWVRDSKTISRVTKGALSEHLRPVCEIMTSMRANLPSQRAVLLSLPGVERVRLQTPDGVLLDGFIAGRTSGAADGGGGAPQRVGPATRLDPSTAPVILYLGGNGEHWEYRSDLLAEFYARQGCVIASVNYRGVGESGGVATRDGAVVDAASAVAYLVHGCGFDVRRVVVVGHSIGGAFAAEACRAFPGALVVSDRSFSRLSDTALYHIAEPAVVGPFAATTAGACVRWAVRTLVRHVAAWELDGAAHFRALPPGAKVAMYTSADRIVPPPVQLMAALAVAHGEGGGGDGVAGEDAGPASSGARAHPPQASHTTTTPHAQVGGLEGTTLMRLYPSHSHGGYDPDAHNRAFSPDEVSRLLGLVQAHIKGRRLPAVA